MRKKRGCKKCPRTRANKARRRFDLHTAPPALYVLLLQSNASEAVSWTIARSEQERLCMKTMYVV